MWNGAGTHAPPTTNAAQELASVGRLPPSAAAAATERRRRVTLGSGRASSRGARPPLGFSLKALLRFPLARSIPILRCGELGGMDLLPRPGNGSLGRSRALLLLLLLISSAASAVVSAQEAGMESGENTSTEATISLDRRTKMLLRSMRKNYVSDQAGLASTEAGLGLFDAFFASLSMIIVSEIGDETFIIAALMAMRHPKSIVLSGALTALFVMTVLSTGLGRIVPNLISRKHTNSAATVLYAFFGLRLLYIAWRSNSKASQKKEMEEVEEKLEAGQGKTMLRRFFSRFCTPIFLESFILTFIAEWGDRSQIATIALATHKNAVGVALGATLGHTICTSIAVVGGSMLAAKISQRTVATVGGLLFLGFSLSSYFYPPL